MFVWFGINIDEQLDKFKSDVLKLSKQYNKITQLQYHPAHISTKISFEIKDDVFENVVDDVLNYYSTLKPFEIKSDKVEKENDIIWLRWNGNSFLKKIHEDLCDIVSNKYNIQLHEFDLSFKYHTTLFVNACELNQNLVDELLNLDFPAKITVSEFFVGKSINNESKNYKIYKSILL